MWTTRCQKQNIVLTIFQTKENCKVLLSSGEPVPCLLLGNKSDLPGRTISDDEIEAFCKQAGFIGYHAISAKVFLS